jgi:hypothetical protein
MTTTEASRHNVKGRMRVLGGVLLVLAAVYCNREIPAFHLFKPRFIVLNDSMGTLDRVVIESECGRYVVGRLEDGQSVAIPIKPRSDCVYSFGHGIKVTGIELLRLHEIAKDQGEDVLIMVNYEGGWIGTR